MPRDSAEAETTPLEAWLEKVQGIIGDAGGEHLTTAEQSALLDIARIAAHASERIAAPLTTFLVGVAYGTLPASERAAALQALADRLER